jgi:hypothetical protein
MYEMMIEWEKDGKTGKFKVQAPTLEACLDIGTETVEEDGAEVMDYYMV